MKSMRSIRLTASGFPKGKAPRPQRQGAAPGPREPDLSGYRMEGAEGHTLVTSPAGSVYRVDTAAGTCTCPAHQFRGVECRHLKMARERS